MRTANIVIAAGLCVAIGSVGCTTTSSTTSAPQARAAQPRPATDGAARGSMYFPTGDRNTSAILLERVAPAQVRSDLEFDYVMRVTNLTTMNLNDVVVRDLCGGNFTYVSSTPPAVGKSPEPLMWGLGDLAPNASKEITVRGKAVSGAPITNCATVSYNSTLCVSTAVVDPELKVAISGPAEASLCDTVCYTYVVTNTGTGTAQNVRVNYNLPAGWSADKPGTSFDAGNLTAGQSREFKVCATPNKTGAVTATTSAASSGGLTSAGNTVNTTIKAPVLTIAAECPGTTLMGRDMTFKFMVKNTGNMASAATTISAPIPASTTFIRADMGGTVAPGKVNWNIGSLAPNDSRTVTMTLQSSNPGRIMAAATATGTCAKPVQDNCSTSVEGVPDIGTSVSDAKGVIVVGDPHTFTYTVRNQGQVDLTNVVVAVVFDDGLQFTGSDWTAGAVSEGQKTTWKIGTVRTGEEKQFKVMVKGTKAGQLHIQATTVSDQTPRGVRNDEQVNYISR